MLRCPVCRKDIQDSLDGERPETYPFCSERCKLIDLGAWLDSEYVITSSTTQEETD